MKKIMFSDAYGLTKDVLEGRKTQTRRIVSQSLMARTNEFRVKYYNNTLDSLTEIEALRQYFLIEKIAQTPYKVGEIIAVAQCYRDILYSCALADDLKNVAGYNNKMFVRGELMPHHIRISDVRIERLQDISEDDCKAEGIMKWCYDNKTYCGFLDYSKDKFYNYNSPREAYAALIDKISGIGTFENNPYVFVYEFELIK